MSKWWCFKQFLRCFFVNLLFYLCCHYVKRSKRFSYFKTEAVSEETAMRELKFLGLYWFIKYEWYYGKKICDFNLWGFNIRIIRNLKLVPLLFDIPRPLWNSPKNHSHIFPFRVKWWEFRRWLRFKIHLKRSKYVKKNDIIIE